VNTPVITAGQVEFAEIFERIERDFKISKAAVARALRIERSYVSMLIKGQRTPHMRVLQDMRELEKRLLAGRDPEGAEEDTELSRIVQQIKILEQHDRPKFEAVKQVVASLVQTSSKPAAAATKRGKKSRVPGRKSASK
jgi:transcriptional regulator with XRE-family HTH domain